MAELLEAVEAVGGEGLILRKADSPHRLGRSRDVLKVKRWHDAEAKVIAWKVQKNSLVCECLEAVPGNPPCQFGLTWNRDAVRPPVGSIVTFAYTELTSAGMPRFPILKWVHGAQRVA